MSNISITNPNGGGTTVNGILFLQGNDAISVPGDPSTHIIEVLGDNTQGVDVSGDAGTYTIMITNFDATESQKGVVLLASNAETIAGTNTTKAITPDDLKAKLGDQTLHGIPYGNSQTGVIQWLDEAIDGFFPIGDTGGVPILGTITSLDGSIKVTLGAGTIDISSLAENGVAFTEGIETLELLSVPLGGSAGTFQFEARVKAYEATGPSGAGYNIYATFITDGINARLVGSQSIFNEDPSLADGDAFFVADGNNASLKVLGVDLLDIRWDGETQLT